MAATEKAIKDTIASSLQWTLFEFISEKSSFDPGPEKTDEYNKAYLSNLAAELLRHVGYGRQDDAERIIKKCPDVLLFSPSRPVNDISGKPFSGTAFQYALWAMDTHMYKMMFACLPQNERGEEIRKDLLRQAKAQSEHFDFEPLIRALRGYLDDYDDSQWSERQEHWCKVIGGVQKSLPAHVRQEYCNPDRAFYPLPTFVEPVFMRSLSFYNWTNSTWQTWDEDLLELGSRFAIGRAEVDKCAGRGRSVSVHRYVNLLSFVSFDLAAITALCEVRTSDLNVFMQQLQTPIQKPDEVQVSPGQSMP